MGNLKLKEMLENKRTDLENDEEFRKIVVDMVLDLENEYYRMKKLSMKSQELFNIRMNKKIKVYFSKLKKQLKDLNNILKEIDNSKENQKKKEYIKKEFTFNQIIYLDLRFKINSYMIFSRLRLEQNSKKRIKMVNELRNIYLNVLKETDREDYQTKNIIRNILSYLNNILKVEKSKNKPKNKPKNKQKILNINNFNNKIIVKENKEKVDLSDEPIYSEILNGDNISEYTLIDILEIFRDIIRKYGINKNLITSVNNIVDRLESESKGDNKYTEYLYSLIDATKIRKASFNKDDIEYKILKNINIILNSYKENLEYSNAVFYDNTSVKYDLICKLLYDEKNYPLIKKIINECPDIVNVRKYGNSIVSHILELYLKNYERLLNKETKDYVNIEFLKEVYYLFTKNDYLYVSSDMEDQINKQIYTFIRRLTGDKTKQILLDDKIVYAIYVKSDKRKKSIIEEIKKMSTHYYYYEKTEFELKRLSEVMLESQINYIENDYLDYRNRGELDLTDEENIILDNKYVAYSFKKCSASNILKISVCDISNLISENICVDRYIYNCMLNKEKIDQRILDKLKFKDNEPALALTYKISLDKNNKPIDLYIYKSKITPKHLDSQDNVMYKDMLKAINGIIKRKNKKIEKNDNEKIYEISKELVNDLYLKLANKRDIPYTYSGVEKISDIEPNIYSVVGSISSKLPSEEFTSIYNIIINNLGEFHYSDKPFDVLDGFDLNLVGDPDYVFLENQRIIKTLILNELNLGIEQYNKRKHILEVEHQNMILDLNGSLGYKNIDDFDYKRRKKRKKILTPYNY